LAWIAFSEKWFMKRRIPVVVAASASLVLVLVELVVLRGPVGDFSVVASSGSVAVYSDVGCSRPVTSVYWGLLWPGWAKNVVVYVRNEGASPLVLVLAGMNWTPVNAGSYLGFSWNHWDLKLMPVQVAEVILMLSVSPQAGNTTFGFNILFEGLDSFPTDLNHDGKVDGRDIVVVARSFGAYPGCSAPLIWNPICDINGDGKVDGRDVSVVCRDFGQSLV
jgi:hypothetical protein